MFETVPPVLKEAAYGIGCTRWEVTRRVVLPYARIGVIGGVMLGLGRALGETMAVTFVIGNAHRISASILAPGTTISAAIANEFTEAVGDLYSSSLIALGLILFLITFCVLAAARLMLMRLERKAGGRRDLVQIAGAADKRCALDPSIERQTGLRAKDEREAGQGFRAVIGQGDVECTVRRRFCAPDGVERQRRVHTPPPFRAECAERQRKCKGASPAPVAGTHLPLSGEDGTG